MLLSKSTRVGIKKSYAGSLSSRITPERESIARHGRINHDSLVLNEK